VKLLVRFLLLDDVLESMDIDASHIAFNKTVTQCELAKKISRSTQNPVVAKV
jgi:hypothetical protein